MNSQSTAVNVAIRHSYVSVRSQRPQSHRIHGNFSAVIRSHAAVSPQSSRKATTQQEPLTKRIVLIGQVSSPRLARSDALAANAAATFARATRPCDTEEFPVSILPRREMPRQGAQNFARRRVPVTKAFPAQKIDPVVCTWLLDQLRWNEAEAR